MPAKKKVTQSSGNIFKDIGLPDPAQHELKARVVLVLSRKIKAKGLSQTAAADLIKIAQPDLSNILRGKFSGFSLERLLVATNALGLDYEIKFKEAPAKRKGKATVAEVEAA
jgi:predicted XRE-type DNA-binding protein